MHQWAVPAKAQRAEFGPESHGFPEGGAEDRAVVTISRDGAALVDLGQEIARRAEQFEPARVRHEGQALFQPLAQGQRLVGLIAAEYPGVFHDAPRALDHDRIAQACVDETAHVLQRLPRAHVARENGEQRKAGHADNLAIRPPFRQPMFTRLKFRLVLSRFAVVVRCRDRLVVQ